MLRVFSVNYDLADFGTPNYEGLITELKRSSGWLHYLKSAFLIATYESADQLYNRIAYTLRSCDRVLVIEVTADFQGWLNKDEWAWINQQLPRYAVV